jgi:putative endonuclease
MYFVYIVKCIDDTFYTGIATDLERRIDEHNRSEKGAKYTRVRRPVSLVYSEEHPDRSSASKREYEIKKKMSRAEKLKLIESD